MDQLILHDVQLPAVSVHLNDAIHHKDPCDIHFLSYHTNVQVICAVSAALMQPFYLKAGLTMAGSSRITVHASPHYCDVMQLEETQEYILEVEV